MNRSFTFELVNIVIVFDTLTAIVAGVAIGGLLAVATAGWVLG